MTRENPTIAAGSRGDLDHRGAIHDLVVAFYREVVFDDLLAPVFIEVAEVDWSEHIPKLVDFWCRVLLGEPGYRGAVLAAHQRVHDIQPFRLELFDRWYSLWVDTIDARWEGPIATLAKEHAARVGASMARRLLDPAAEPVSLRSRPDLQLHEWTTS